MNGVLKLIGLGGNVPWITDQPSAWRRGDHRRCGHCPGAAVVLYIFVQRFVIQGVASSGVKG